MRLHTQCVSQAHNFWPATIIHITIPSNTTSTPMTILIIPHGSFQLEPVVVENLVTKTDINGKLKWTCTPNSFHQGLEMHSLTVSLAISEGFPILWTGSYPDYNYVGGHWWSDHLEVHKAAKVSLSQTFADLACKFSVCIGNSTWSDNWADYWLCHGQFKGRLEFVS